MLIEHRGLLSWVLERRDGSKKQKPCARLQDADRSGRSASCDPAMVFGFRMASIPSGHTGALPVVPSRRIAAGLSVGTNANTEARCSPIMPRMLAVNGSHPTRTHLDEKPLNKRFR